MNDLMMVLAAGLASGWLANMWVSMGLARRCERLDERNAAQAQTIAGLQARLSRRGSSSIDVRELTEAEHDAWLRAMPQGMNNIMGKMYGSP